MKPRRDFLRALFHSTTPTNLTVEDLSIYCTDISSIPIVLRGFSTTAYLPALLLAIAQEISPDLPIADWMQYPAVLGGSLIDIFSIEHSEHPECLLMLHPGKYRVE